MVDYGWLAFETKNINFHFGFPISPMIIFGRFQYHPVILSISVKSANHPGGNRFLRDMDIGAVPTSTTEADAFCVEKRMWQDVVLQLTGLMMFLLVWW